MADRTVSDIMTVDPVTVVPETGVTEAAQLMVDNRIGALPVLQDGRLVGLVTEGDLIHQDVKLEFPTYIQLLDGISCTRLRRRSSRTSSRRPWQPPSAT